MSRVIYVHHYLPEVVFVPVYASSSASSSEENKKNFQQFALYLYNRDGIEDHKLRMHLSEGDFVRQLWSLIGQSWDRYWPEAKMKALLRESMFKAGWYVAGTTRWW
jgi:hypothetical protein